MDTLHYSYVDPMTVPIEFMDLGFTFDNFDKVVFIKLLSTFVNKHTLKTSTGHSSLTYIHQKKFFRETLYIHIKYVYS